MAQSRNNQKPTYPLPVYNFRVTVDGTAVGFQDVSGLVLEYQTVTYRHGLSFLEGEDIEKYHLEKYVQVTLKKGVVKGDSFLLNWLKDNRPRMVRVSLCDESGRPVITWRISRALAVKLEASTFDANSNQVSIDTLSLQAAGISVEHH